MKAGKPPAGNGIRAEVSEPALPERTQFRTDALIDDGSFGRVYSGHDLKLGRRVAIKFIDGTPAVVDAALAQARILARFEHPNIVQVFQVAPARDPQREEVVEAVIMAYVDGTRLDRLLRERVLSLAERELIGIGIIAGIARMHDAGVTHGDFHGGNILCTSRGPVIIDPTPRSSLGQLSAEARKVELVRDLEFLRDRLRDLLRGLPQEPQGAGVTVGDGGLSIESLSAAFHLEVAAHARGGTAPSAPPTRASRAWFAAGTAALALLIVASLAVLRGSKQAEPPPPIVASTAAPLATLDPPTTASPPPAVASVHSPSTAVLPLEDCPLPPFGTGAKRLYLAVTDSEGGARLLHQNVLDLLNGYRGAHPWSTAIGYHPLTRNPKSRWVVTAVSLAPGAARGWCSWMQCRGWSLQCSEDSPHP